MDHTPAPDQSSKLTSWANEPTLIKLKEDLQVAEPAQVARALKIDHWNNLIQVKGSAAPPKKKGRSSVQPKLIRRQNEWRYSALSEPFLGSNKLFKVTPVSWEDEDGARQNELVLNWQFRTQFNKVKFIDDYVRSTVDEGTSIVRTGWHRITVPVKTEAPVYDHYPIESHADAAGQAQQLQQALQLRDEDPKAYNEQVPPELKAAVDYFDESQQPTYAVQTGTQTVTSEKVICNKPTVEVINPKNFFLDPTCNGDPAIAHFAIFSFETTKAALMKEPKRYPKAQLDKVNWETATPITSQNHESNTPDTGMQVRDILRKRVVAYEYWGVWDIDGDGNLQPIVATWIGDTIVRMEKNPYPDQKIPFVIVPYLPVKRDAFGEPDAELLEDQQKVVGALMRGMIDLLGRSANAQRGMAKGMLDPLNKRRYENGDDYEFNPNNRPDAGIIEHKMPELPQSALAMLNLQNMEAEALTGVKSFSGGMSGEAYGDVAAGIRGVLDAASKREMAILRRLAQGMAEIGTKIIAMNAVFLSEQEVVRVTNEQFVQLSPAQQSTAQQPGLGHNGGPPLDDQPDQFVTVNREDLAGNFDLEVDIATAEVDDAKSKDLAFMLQTIGPDEDPDMRRMILAEICDLKRMPALAHKIRTYKPKPDPIQQKIQELTLQKLQMEVNELQTQAELNQAKAQQATADAALKGSAKDAQDLDYVEQETGTKHVREMDKISGQARANQDLEVTKALLAQQKPDHKKPNVEAAVGFNSLSEAKDRVENNIPDNFGGIPALTS